MVSNSYLVHFGGEPSSVSVPSRGDWGLLRNKEVFQMASSLFPYLLEVIGGSYQKKVTSTPNISCFRPLPR